MIPRSAPVALAAALALSSACGCAAPGAHAPPSGAGLEINATPVADAATVALWHLDETAGTPVEDAGPFSLLGVAGLDTRTDYGRYGRARVFTRSLDSFVEVPFNPALEIPSAFTIEAWVRPNSYGTYEDTPIVARWTAQNADHSWILSIVGNALRPPIVPLPSPGDHAALTGVAAPGTLYFAFQPADAGTPRAYYATRAIETARWTHVAASYDGRVVRLWIDGRLDAQYASLGRIRATTAPLEIGNTIDPHILSTFGGDLRANPGGNPTPYYAFDGMIDEVRLSGAARDSFESVRRP